jgi:hypothetical protein
VFRVADTVHRMEAALSNSYKEDKVEGFEVRGFFVNSPSCSVDPWWNPRTTCDQTGFSSSLRQCRENPSLSIPIVHDRYNT